jgi:tRNA pseudouridine13 synthase
VAGNRFRILVTGAHADAVERSAPIAEQLERHGIPNYFGPQRFGHNMTNLDRAAALLASAKSIRGRKNNFLVSALQGALFNQWLTNRIQRGDYGRLMDGDVAKKTDTGGLFVVDDPVEANERFDRGAVVYTGPIYGHKMMSAGGSAGQYETGLLDRFELSADTFKKLRAQGTRRVALLRNIDLAVTAEPEGIWFTFNLPSGAYATTVLREFMQTPAG